MIEYNAVRWRTSGTRHGRMHFRGIHVHASRREYPMPTKILLSAALVSLLGLAPARAGDIVYPAYGEQIADDFVPGSDSPDSDIVYVASRGGGGGGGGGRGPSMGGGGFRGPSMGGGG